MPITRIVSGGQTGADRGGLDAAIYPQRSPLVIWSINRPIGHQSSPSRAGARLLIYQVGSVLAISIITVLVSCICQGMDADVWV